MNRVSIERVDELEGLWSASAGPWWVLRTRSRQEKALCEQLQAGGVVHYLPLAQEARYYGRRKVVAKLPVFPGYVFMRGARDQTFWADRTGRVAQILEVPDQKQFQEELSHIASTLSAGYRLRRLDRFPTGARVEVVSGPLKGMFGTVRRDGPQDRLVLGLSVVGLASEVEIDSSLLRVID